MKCTLNCITLSSMISWFSAKLLQLCVAQKLLFLKSNAREISPPSGYTKYCMMRTGKYPHHTLRTACIGVAWPCVCSLVPRPSSPPVFDHLQYAKNGGGRPGEFHHVICHTADVTDSKRKSLFTFISTVTEKLENQNKRPCNHAHLLGLLWYGHTLGYKIVIISKTIHI